VLLTLVVLAVGVVCAAVIATSLAAGPVWILLAASSLWLPANNHHLEGPVLLTVVRNHGVTLSDLGGIGGFVVATTILVRRVARTPQPLRTVPPAWVLAYCCGTFALGALAAWVVG
jgi:tetrahydromethanopterin S-methyltransferase subunit E